MFEKSVQLGGCVWPYAKRRTQCCVLDYSTCDSGRRWSTNWDANGRTWSPRLSRWWRGRGLKNNRATCKAKRERMHTISHRNGTFTIVIFSCSFWGPPLKNRPCRSANLILESRSVFIRARPNPQRPQNLRRSQSFHMISDRKRSIQEATWNLSSYNCAGFLIQRGLSQLLHMFRLLLL